MQSSVLPGGWSLVSGRCELLDERCSMEGGCCQHTWCKNLIIYVTKIAGIQNDMDS